MGYLAQGQMNLALPFHGNLFPVPSTCLCRFCYCCHSSLRMTPNLFSIYTTTVHMTLLSSVLTSDKCGRHWNFKKQCRLKCWRREDCSERRLVALVLPISNKHIASSSFKFCAPQTSSAGCGWWRFSDDDHLSPLLIDRKHLPITMCPEFSIYCCP